MLLTEYNEAKQMELFREEGREEGRAEGADEQAQKTAKNLFGMGMKPSEIATVLEQSLSKVRDWLSMAAL